LNRLDDAALDKAMADPALGHYRPWIEDIRKDKPFQLEDRVEQLFHEKSVTGYSAFNRLFDETMVALRFKVGGKSLPLEQTLNIMQDADPKKRKAAAEALAKTFKENLRLFTLVTNTLAKDKEISDRWRGFGDVAQSRHLANRVEPEVWMRWCRRCAGHLACRTATRAEGEMVRQEAVAALGPAPLPRWRTHRRLATARSMLTAYGTFSPKMASVPNAFQRPLDQRAGAAKSPGAFAHPTVPSAHPYVMLNYQGKPRDADARPGSATACTRCWPRQQPADGADADAGRTATCSARCHLQNCTARPPTKQRKAMLAAKVEDMINTVVRQIAFYSFERRSTSSGGTASSPRSSSAPSGSRCSARAWVPPSISAPATRCSGPTFRTSSIRRSTSTPIPSATAW
jgi:oligoendopeptidase F